MKCSHTSIRLLPLVLILCIQGCVFTTHVPGSALTLTPIPTPRSTVSIPSPDPVLATGPHFRLHILKDDWHDLELGYEQEQAWAKLREIDLRDSIVVITENDIEEYDWSGQVITLTLAASTELKETFDDDVLFHWVTVKQAFVVTYDGEWLYGGVFSDFASAAGIQFPVICMDYHKRERITLYLRPENLCWAFSQTEMVEAGQIFRRPEVHTLFVRQGKLIER